MRDLLDFFNSRHAREAGLKAHRIENQQTLNNLIQTISKGEKESYEKALAEKDKIIEYLKREIRKLEQEIVRLNKSNR